MTIDGAPLSGRFRAGTLSLWHLDTQRNPETALSTALFHLTSNLAQLLQNPPAVLDLFFLECQKLRRYSLRSPEQHLPWIWQTISEEIVWLPLKTDVRSIHKTKDLYTDYLKHAEVTLHCARTSISAFALNCDPCFISSPIYDIYFLGAWIIHCRLYVENNDQLYPFHTLLFLNNLKIKEFANYLIVTKVC